MASDPEHDHALEEYKKKLLESREWEAKLKALRMDIKGLQKDYETSEDNIKALQSVGQIIGEVLKQLDEERCLPHKRHPHRALIADVNLQSSSRPLRVRATLLDADRISTGRD